MIDAEDLDRQAAELEAELHRPMPPPPHHQGPPTKALASLWLEKAERDGLVRRCPECNGRGRQWPFPSYSRTCRACDGEGFFDGVDTCTPEEKPVDTLDKLGKMGKTIAGQ